MSAPTTQTPQNCSCEGDITCENCVNSQQIPEHDNVRVSAEIPQDTIVSSIVAEILERLNSPGT